ncbi:Ig-like domain-containing protein [Oscillatoria amoena NRMC-F 0135]|nr:Ig-like domain-containing protein [Oscillatoria amoena NRMC-F 0135]
MRFIGLVILVCLLAGCAKQTNPTGGPTDTDPPQLIRSNPGNRQTNFNSSQIELIFNEHVQVNNAREQIIIVPTIGKKFEASARRNKVTLKFNNQLLDSTTYTINFREAIQDLSEKNPAKNLKFAFSTGNYIDSLSVEGSVQLLLKNLPAENFTVAVVPLSDTFNIFNHAAQFFTLTDKSGQYALENLKPGNYKIYAFHDKNKNLKVDSRSEPFAFRSDTVRLYQSIKDLQLHAVGLDMRPLRILSSKPVGNHFLVRLNKGYTRGSFKSEHSDRPVRFDYPDYTSIRFYNTLAGLDSMPVQFAFTDSINHTLDTTLYIKFNQLNLQKERFTVKAGTMTYIEHKQSVKGELIFSKPVHSILYDSIYIRLDSATVLSFGEEDFVLDKSFTQAILSKQLPGPLGLTSPRPARSAAPVQQQRTPGGMDSRVARTTQPQSKKPDPKTILNQLILAKGAILSVEEDTLSFQNIPFTVIKPETSAVLFLEIHAGGSTITQLLDKDYKVVNESTAKKIRFDNIAPGEYYVRAIRDINNNARWDPGNYNMNQEPEPVRFYQDDTGNNKINLKANWELGPLLIRH